MKFKLLATLVSVGLICAAPASAAPWRELHRPLDLPDLRADGSCPVSSVDNRVNWGEASIFGGSGIGRGPVYAGLGTTDPVGNVQTDDLKRLGYQAKVFWYVVSKYRDRVLIRGRGLSGEGELNFSDIDNKADPRELRINRGQGSTSGWPGKPAGSRGEPSGVFVPGPGCYAVQVDGVNFSRSIVFTATLPQG